eukprot:gene3123-33229_t
MYTALAGSRNKALTPDCALSTLGYTDAMSLEEFLEQNSVMSQTMRALERLREDVTSVNDYTSIESYRSLLASVTKLISSIVSMPRGSPVMSGAATTISATRSTATKCIGVSLPAPD